MQSNVVVSKVEVELKYKLLPGQRVKITRSLKKDGFKYVERVAEIDTYYTRKDVDFLKTKECLRIRRTKDYSELTHKPSSTKKMKSSGSFWKLETNIPITGQEEEMHHILINIGMLELATVVKSRSIYKSKKITVVFDKIKKIGDYLEIEILTDKSGTKKAIKDLILFAEHLGLKEEELVRLPYRDLVTRQSN